MTDTKKLKEKITQSGLKIGFIAERVGISRQGLYHKINGDHDFTASEMAKLQDILHLSLDEKEQIFFAK